MAGLASVWHSHPDAQPGAGSLLSTAMSEATGSLNAEDRAPDPLLRLLSEKWTETLWEYEHSRTDPFIPGNPHPKQWEVLRAPARHRWLFWGNQCGKTTIGAVDVALLALGRHPTHQKWAPPLNCWASALTWEMWETVLLPELLTWIPKDRIVDAPEPYAKSNKRTILVRADNGRISRIEGKSAEQGAAKYQSRRLHVFWLDEEHPEPVWDEVQPRLLRHGGITIATMTPLKGLTWVYERIYEPYKAGKTEQGAHFCSHAGLMDNPSIGKKEIADMTRELQNNPAMLQARLYGHFVRPQGMVLPFDTKHFEHLDDLSLTTLLARGKIYVGIDFGLWRFAAVIGCADRAGRMHIVDELFSQRESLDTRAEALHNKLSALGAPKGTPIWGDCANPQDIVELNNCLRRINSPYRVNGVAAENKVRKVGVERIENLMNRGAFFVRRGTNAGVTWFLGMNASKQGKPVEGSRWVWEARNWLYPKAEDGKIQKDEPDDASADGSDMMAATRYLVMSWWKNSNFEVPAEDSAWSKKVLEAEAERLRRGQDAPAKPRRRRRRQHPLAHA